MVEWSSLSPSLPTILLRIPITSRFFRWNIVWKNKKLPEFVAKFFQKIEARFRIRKNRIENWKSKQKVGRCCCNLWGGYSWLWWSVWSDTGIQKVAQFFPGSFYFNMFSKYCKSHQTFEPFLKGNLSPRTFKNRPIWSHWWWWSSDQRDAQSSLSLDLNQ